MKNVQYRQRFAPKFIWGILIILTLTPPIHAQPANHAKPPIVLVHGWRGLDSMAPCTPGVPDTDPDYPDEYWLHFDDDLIEAGFSVTYARLITGYSLAGDIAGCTPVAEANVPFLIGAIDEALAANPGHNKVILIAHSMGGLVARAYLEGSAYRDDVAELYTLGTPHLGVPINGLVALIQFITLGGITLDEYCTGQPIVCQFSDDEALVNAVGFTGIAAFNDTYSQRQRNTLYHFVGGHADFNDRSNTGVIMDNFIGIENDGIVPRVSATGVNSSQNNLGPMTGPFERRNTYELHSESMTAGTSCITQPIRRRYTYYSQDQYERSCPIGGETVTELLSESFIECLTPVLINRLPNHRCTNSSLNTLEARSTPTQPKAILPTNFATLNVGQSMTRTIWLEGGDGMLMAKAEAGTQINVKLRRPDGTIINSGDTDQGDVRIKNEGNSVGFKLENAEAGPWEISLIILDGPSNSAKALLGGAVESSIKPHVRLDRPTYRRGDAGRLTVAIDGDPTDVYIEARIGTQQLQLRPNNGLYTALFDVPDQAGVYDLRVNISGVTANGQPFEQVYRNIVTVASDTFHLTGQFTDRIASAHNHATLTPDLVIDVGVQAAMAGKIGVVADLVDANGNRITSSSAFAVIKPGKTSIPLRFRGHNLRATTSSGPYTVYNLRLIDYQTGGGTIIEAMAEEYTTATYSLADFVPARKMLPHFASPGQGTSARYIDNSVHTCAITPTNPNTTTLAAGDSFQLNFSFKPSDDDSYPEWLDYYYIASPENWPISGQSAARPNVGGWAEVMTQTHNATNGLAYWGIDYASVSDLDLMNSVLPKPGSFRGPWRPDASAPYTFDMAVAIPETLPTCPGSVSIGLPADSETATGIAVGDLTAPNINETSCAIGGYVCPLPTVSLQVTVGAGEACTNMANIEIPSNRPDVTFCYTVTNDSNLVTVSVHSLDTSMTEKIDTVIALKPGQSHMITSTAMVTGTQGVCKDNNATWTAKTNTGFGQPQNGGANDGYNTHQYEAVSSATATVCLAKPEPMLFYMPVIAR